jgi:tRNA pseudouridine55 synthase
MHGILVVDKPHGVTSHDVVAAARRALRETRIGHTGTLDPLATGVLPLAIGRATRLVRFLTASDKEYEATVRFGFTTDSYDVTGAETSRTDAVPSRDAVLAALDPLRGGYLQRPPAFSAKKVGGRRAYDLARRDQAVTLTPVPVRVSRADLLELTGSQARLVLTCSAGFYVRSFAHALGERTGTGACLEALRRTRSGEFTLDDAVRMDMLSEEQQVASRLIPLDRLLPGFPAVRVTSGGRGSVSHGRELSASDYEPVGGSASRHPPYVRGPGAADVHADPASGEWVRILDDAGALVAIGTRGRSLESLHPSVVLI